MTEDNVTPEQSSAIKEYLGYGAPLPEEKYNVHSFLHKVATSDDTTKLGNLTAEEIGQPRHTLRTYKEIALIADKISTDEQLKDYYNAKAEILTSTSLSKDAKLINLAVVQKRQIEDVTKKPKENTGWFKSKKDPNENQGEQP